MNKKARMNKKAVAFIPIILFLGAIFLVIYLLGFLPIPSFAKIKNITNYYILVIIWFLVQGLFIYLYFKGATYITKGISFIKQKIIRGSYNLERYLITNYS